MASVTYSINGKHDKSGIESAEQSLKKLQDTAKAVGGKINETFSKLNDTIKTIATFHIITKGVEKVKDVFNGATNVFKANEKALSTLTMATSKNTKLTATSLQNVIDFTNKLSSVNESLFSSSELQGYAAFLANLNLTEDQIRNTLTAAIELSSAGFGNMESNIKNLAKTYGGLTGELGESMPFLKKLTKEQLEMGAAIDLVNEKYAGFSKNLAQNTLEGKENRFNSAISSIQGSVGTVLGKMKGIFLDDINPMLEKLATWVEENAPKIGATLISYFKVAETIVQNIMTNFDTLSTGETWKNFFEKAVKLGSSFVRFLGSLLGDTLSNAATLFVHILTHINWGSVLSAPTRFMAGVANFFGNKEAAAEFSEAADNFERAINERLGENGNSLPTLTISDETVRAGEEFARNLGETFTTALNTLAGTDVIALQEKYYREALAALSKGGGDGGNDVNGFGKNLSNILSDVAAGFSGEFDTTIKNMSDILPKLTTKTAAALKKQMDYINSLADESKQDISKYLALMQKATNPQDAMKYYDAIQEKLRLMNDLAGNLKKHIAQANAEIKKLEYQANFEAAKEAAKQTIKDKATGASEVSDVVQGFAQGGPLGAIAVIIGKIVEIFSSIENLGKVLNPFTTILERIKDILEPLLNELFAPFVIILETLGDIIGNILAPVFTTLMAILHPILNLVITLLNTIAPIISIIGKIISLIVKLEPALILLNMALSIISAGIAFIYNKIIMPIVNLVIKAVTTVINFVAGIVNSVIKLLNKIPGVDIDEMGTVNYDDVKLQELTATQTGNTDYGDTASASGGSASYTAAKDIYVNIYFDHSFVNGDAREIALMLRDELQSAAALGY